MPPPAPTGRRSAGDPDSDPCSSWAKSSRTHFRGGRSTCLGVQPLSLGVSSRWALFVGTRGTTSHFGGGEPGFGRAGRWLRPSVPLGPALLLLKLSGSRIQGGAGEADTMGLRRTSRSQRGAGVFRVWEFLLSRVPVGFATRKNRACLISGLIKGLYVDETEWLVPRGLSTPFNA